MLERDALAVGADDLLDGRAWNGEVLTRDGHRERRDDREGKRNAQGHARTLAGLAVDLDDTADPFNVGPDHVHADAPARDGGHLLGRRQTGFEDQRQPVARAELGGFVFGDDAARNGLFDQALAVDAAAVVLDID